jgi:DNA-binding GntR family transcriptional regulator
MIIPISNIKTRMYKDILNSIIRGEYRPESLLTEKMLTEKYKVSKSPIREALIELCKEGVLRSIPRLGYEVIRITDKDIADVQDFRLLIECGSMDKYWDKIDSERIKAVILNRQACIECDAFEHWAHNSKFHLQLIHCFGNKFLYDSLSDALKFLSRAYAQFYWEQWHRMTFISKEEHHKKILEHILNGEKESAIAALKEDINEFARGDEFFKPIFPD